MLSWTQDWRGQGAGVSSERHRRLQFRNVKLCFKGACSACGETPTLLSPALKTELDGSPICAASAQAQEAASGVALLLGLSSWLLYDLVC